MKKQITALAFFMWAIMSQSIFALPTGGQVVVGGAQTIQNYSTNMAIRQNSGSEIVNWSAFSISQGEQVHFLQPSTSTVALNRVLGNNPSKIFGSLTANGRVILINSSGVVFGANATAAICRTADNQEIGISLAGGGIARLEPLDSATLPDEPHKPSNMIYGLFDIQVQVANPGDTASVTVQLPKPAPTGYKWFKYQSGKGWYDFSNHAVFSADRMQVTLTLTDGGIGDDDGVANGVIIDPSGLGTGDAPPGTPMPASTISNAGSGGGGCFIATAAYGSALDPHVTTLRMFRDRFLLTNPVGRALVNLYYLYSPPAAAFIARYDTLRLLVRIGLLPVFLAGWTAVNYGAIALLALVTASCGTAGCVGVWWWKRNVVRI